MAPRLSVSIGPSESIFGEGLRSEREDGEAKDWSRQWDEGNGRGKENRNGRGRDKAGLAALWRDGGSATCPFATT